MTKARILILFVLQLVGMFMIAYAESDSGKRDLTRYDKAGPYKVVHWRKDELRTQAEIRGFVWDHWQRRRRGWLTVTTYTKEGAAITSSYFVEPAGQGKWKVSVHREREEYYVGGGHALKSSDFDSYTLRRIERRSATGTTEVPIASEAAVSADAYELVLVDRDGKERDIL